MKMFVLVVVTWISAIACAQKAKVEAPPPPPPEVQEIHREAEAFQTPASDVAPAEEPKKTKKKKAAKKSTKSKKG